MNASNANFPRRLLLALCLMATSMGNHCSDFGHDDEDEHETHRTRASVVATGLPSGETAVQLSLHADDGSVHLSDRESVTAYATAARSSEATGIAMQEAHGLAGTQYVEILPGNAKDTVIEVELDRSRTEGLIAADSSARLPTPFAIAWVTSRDTRESAPLDFSRRARDARFVTWAPFGAPDFEEEDELRFSVTGDCIQPWRGTIDWRGGEEALELTNVLRDRDPRGSGSCVVEVELTLFRLGEVDPAFESGRFVAEQVRTLQLLSRP